MWMPIRTRIRPVLERALRLRSRGERGLAVVEDNEERVALRVDLDAAVALEGRAQQPPMLRQRVRVAVAQLLRAGASSPRCP